MGAEVSLERAGSWLPLDQNSLHTTEAHLGMAYSEPPQRVWINDTHTMFYENKINNLKVFAFLLF